jgi:NAD+ synthase
MATLYAISGIVGGRVANTSNLSEDWVGYATKFGDTAGDFSPLSNLTVMEIKAIGQELGLAPKFIDKTPIDGLCGKTDEDSLGFTYAVLDRYILEGACEDEKVREKIDRLHKANLHKMVPMPAFEIIRGDIGG